MENLIGYGAMLDELQLDIYVVDFATNEVIYANKNFKQRYDFDAHEPCYKMINANDKRCVFCRRNELLDKEGKPSGEMLVYERFNEFDERWYQRQERAIYWDDGRIVKYVIAVDIGGVKETQNRLAEAHAKLAIKSKELEESYVQQARQAQLGELLDFVAHQWKQPLSALLILFNELKLLHTINALDGESLMKIYENGKDTIDGMSKALDDFRKFFSPSSNKKIFEPSAAIKSAYELIKKKFVYDDIDFTLNIADEGACVEGIQNEFAQVALVLLTNASDAIKAGQNRKETKGQISVNIVKKDDNIHIEFLDNGGGIPSELLDKIFQNRFTTKQESGGSGVGLSIAKTIIEEKMGGTIEVYNTDNGACFAITLKVAENI